MNIELQGHGIPTPRLVAYFRSGERIEDNLVELRLSADEASVIELALEDATFHPPFQTHTPSGSRSSVSPPPKIVPLPHHRVLLRSSDILWLGRVDIPEDRGAI